MRRIRAIVLAVIVSLSLLASASVANATPEPTSANFGGDGTSEQLDPGDPGLPPD